MQKQTVICEENPKWRIYKEGTYFCQIGPLSRDRARILYLIILWVKPSSTSPFVILICLTPDDFTRQGRAEPLGLTIRN